MSEPGRAPDSQSDTRADSRPDSRPNRGPGSRPSSRTGLIGVRVGAYETEELIGRGGMGAVYRARHRETGAPVAVKLVLASRIDGPRQERAVARFHREVEVLARIEPHPNVVAVHTSGVSKAGVPWAAMELVSGRSLAAAILDGGPLPPEEAARMTAKIARALAHVHRHGVVHRDLKPENVLIDDRGEPRLVDFGLAFDVFAEQLTRTGECLGTPAFMAPEQVSRRSETESGTVVDATTDVYGAGAVLYAALTGRAPFVADEPMALIHQVLKVAPEPPDASVPLDLAAVCLRALEKEPADRYATTLELADDLERWLAGDVVSADTASRRWSRHLPAFLRPRTRTGRVTIAVAGVSLVAASIAVLGIVSGNPFATPPARRVEALGAALELAGRLPAADVRELETIAGDEGAPDAARRRARALLVAASAAAGEADQAAIADLARLVRPDGAIDRTLSRRIAEVLRRADRPAALGAVLWGLEPSTSPSPGEATMLARALAAGIDGLAPPTDEKVFSALLRAAGLDAAERGALEVRRAERHLARGEAGFGEALAALERAFDDHAVPPVGARWPSEFRRFTFVEADRRLRAREPTADRLLDLIVQAGTGDTPPPLAEIARIQQWAGVNSLVSETVNDASARQAERMMRAGPFLAAFGYDPIHPVRMTVLRETHPPAVLIAHGEEEMARRRRRRNPSRLVWLGYLLRPHDRDKAEQLIRAGADSGVEDAWLQTQVGRFLEWRRLYDEALPYLERAYEIDRAFREVDRRPVIAERLANLILKLERAGPGESAHRAYDPPRAARLVVEACQVQLAVDPRLAEITEAGAQPPWWLSRGEFLGAVVNRAAQHLLGLGPPACCGGGDVPSPEELVDLGLVMDERPLGKLANIIDAEGYIPIGAELLRTGADHHRRHGRFDQALHDLDRAIEEETEFIPPGPLGQKAHFRRLASAHLRRAEVLDEMRRGVEAAEARAASRQAAAKAE